MARAVRLTSHCDYMFGKMNRSSGVLRQASQIQRRVHRGCSPVVMSNRACKRLMRTRAAYDNPALYSIEDQFSDRLFWDKRYEKAPETFEWYRSYASLSPVLSHHLPKDKPILHVGVGTSTIQEDMVLDGYTDIINVDYSATAIEICKTQRPQFQQLKYEVADCTSMPQYEDNSFHGILDKGTLDALLCGGDEQQSYKMLSECRRVLAPGGCYVMVTWGGPSARMVFLKAKDLDWNVSLYEVGQQGKVAGPFREDEFESTQLPHFQYSHFVYVCTKQ